MTPTKGTCTKWQSSFAGSSLVVLWARQHYVTMSVRNGACTNSGPRQKYLYFISYNLHVPQEQGRVSREKSLHTQSGS